MAQLEIVPKKLKQFYTGDNPMYEAAKIHNFIQNETSMEELGFTFYDEGNKLILHQHTKTVMECDVEDCEWRGIGHYHCRHCSGQPLCTFLEAQYKGSTAFQKKKSVADLIQYQRAKFSVLQELTKSKIDYFTNPRKSGLARKHHRFHELASQNDGQVLATDMFEFAYCQTSGCIPTKLTEFIQLLEKRFQGRFPYSFFDEWTDMLYTTCRRGVS